jgi:hypothetical protein
MTGVPEWVAPTVAISLAIIAACAVVTGAIAVAIGLGLRRRGRDLSKQLGAITGDAKALAARLRIEIESYAELSGDARGKLQSAMTAVQVRLEDLDALADVLQDEVEDAALGAAALLRTARRSGRILGAARRVFRRRKPARKGR